MEFLDYVAKKSSNDFFVWKIFTCDIYMKFNVTSLKLTTNYLTLNKLEREINVSWDRNLLHVQRLWLK